MLISASAVLLAAVALASLLTGPTGISASSLGTAFQALTGYTDDIEARRNAIIIFNVRLPRTLLGIFVGGALATAGALIQGMFRNPLADPGLIGVSSGAALAAVATIALGNTLFSAWTKAFGIYALPVAAFVGAVVTTHVLVMIASRRGRVSIEALLLAGIAMAALAGSLTGLIAYTSDDRELRDLTLWSMGSLGGASWPKVIAVTPFAIGLLIVVPSLTRALNGFLLGEAEAYHLGIDTEKAKRLIVAATAAGVGAAVAVAGMIGFVGLVIPHIVRMLTGPDHTTLLPAAALLGGSLVVGGDIVARMVIMPAELPIGLVMSAFGAPIFLRLILTYARG
jgi:iron complex transport system permease protein